MEQPAEPTEPSSIIVQAAYDFDPAILLAMAATPIPPKQPPTTNQVKSNFPQKNYFFPTFLVSSRRTYQV